MRCSFSQPGFDQSPGHSTPLAFGETGGGARERCLFTSVLTLGALFGLMASPCARVPFVSAFVVMGVPLMTFAVAAPSRLGLFRELGLFFRGVEATVLAGLLGLLGRTADAGAVLRRQRTRVENSYVNGGGRAAAVFAADPARLHHARRIATAATLLTVVAGVGLPLIFPSVYTVGTWPMAPLVIAFDVLVIGLTARVVTERMSVRLVEASAALGGGHPWLARVRITPLVTLLGAAMGAVAALVVLSAASLASALETSWMFDHVDKTRAAFWFLRQTAPLALPLGIGIGAVLGAGAGLAQPKANKSDALVSLR